MCPEIFAEASNAIWFAMSRELATFFSGVLINPDHQYHDPVYSN